MKRYCVVAVSPIVWGVAWLCSVPVWAQSDANATIEQTGAIFTYVLDTGAPSTEPLAADHVVSKPGWRVVPEDASGYAFTGDAVLLNDKLAAVVRGAGVDIYTLNEEGATLRGSIAPALFGGKRANQPTAVTLTESTPGAGELEVAYGDAASISYRLTTGQIQLELSPTSGVEAVLVDVPSHYLVAPDFFADDLVYTATMFEFDRVGIPAENFFLHLAGDGDLIVTCVWNTPLRQTYMRVTGDGDGRAIAGSTIACEDGDRVWVAFAEHEGMWHTRDIAPGEVGKAIALTWAPPFSAKWRGDFVMQSEAAQSWNFAAGIDERSEVAGRGVAANPCWFEAETAHVQFEPKGTLPNVSTPAVIYPIDRTQATPLNLFLLVDVMRSTLGMGPCQYILDLEGLDAQSTPTPALVTEWIEAQVKRKRGKQSIKNVDERLQAMVDHVEHAEHRIASYGEFAESITADSDGAQRILADMRSTISELASARKTPEEAEALAAEIRAAVENDAGLEAIEHPAEALRALGAAQDRTLAKCRMGVRRLEQFCLTTSADGGSPELNAILQRTRSMLAETK